MKSRILLYFISILFVITFSLSIIDMCNAEEGYYKLNFVRTDYEIIKQEEVKGIMVLYVNFTIVINNSGNIESGDITVTIQDAEGNYSDNSTILPGETKAFTWTDHPLLGLGPHTVYVRFYPTDIHVSANLDNSDSTTLIISAENDGTDGSTPGFEWILFIGSIIVIILMRKKDNY